MSETFTPIGKGFRLAEIDPRDTGKAKHRDDLADKTAKDLERLEKLHYLMFAENRRSLLIILQGMDASGKDGLIRHLAAGLNPQGLKVHSFKTPSAEELDHEYLWRVHKAAPPRGEVAIFNRSHYEEVIIVRVHPELLERQQLPPEVVNDDALFETRYRQINDFERMLVENGTVILKFLLHISPEEQMERLQERLDDPRKQWKFSKGDLVEREHWERYMQAFEEMIRATHTEHAPWLVVPADRKWYRNYLVARSVVKTLERLDMKFPRLDESNT